MKKVYIKPKFGFIPITMNDIIATSNVSFSYGGEGEDGDEIE